MDPETSSSNNSTINSSSSVPSRFFQRIINAATSRIYPSGNKEREVGEAIEGFDNSLSSHNANDVANIETEIVPSVPTTSENNQQVTTTKSNSSNSGGIASSDMELDENFADL